jgi:hypothetical protein
MQNVLIQNSPTFNNKNLAFKGAGKTIRTVKEIANKVAGEAAIYGTPAVPTYLLLKKAGIGEVTSILTALFTGICGKATVEFIKVMDIFEKAFYSAHSNRKMKNNFSKRKIN